MASQSPIMASQSPIAQHGAPAGQDTAALAPSQHTAGPASKSIRSSRGHAFDFCSSHKTEIGVIVFGILGGIFAYLSRQGLLGIPSALGPNGVMGISLGVGLLPAVVYVGVKGVPHVLVHLGIPKR